MEVDCLKEYKGKALKYKSYSEEKSVNLLEDLLVSESLKIATGFSLGSGFTISAVTGIVINILTKIIAINRLKITLLEVQITFINFKNLSN